MTGSSHAGESIIFSFLRPYSRIHLPFIYSGNTVSGTTAALSILLQKGDTMSSPGARRAHYSALSVEIRIALPLMQSNTGKNTS